MTISLERVMRDAQDRVDRLADDCTKGWKDPNDALAVVRAMVEALNIVIAGLIVDVSRRDDPPDGRAPSQ